MRWCHRLILSAHFQFMTLGYHSITVTSVISIILPSRGQVALTLCFTFLISKNGVDDNSESCVCYV